MLAVLGGHAETAGLLMARGAAVRRTNLLGDGPLLLAAAHGLGRLGAVKRS
jgi:hypothetical protein